MLPFNFLITVILANPIVAYGGGDNQSPPIPPIPPSGFGLASSTDNSWLEFSCGFIGLDFQQINCRFIQTAIRQPKPFDKKQFWIEMKNAPMKEILKTLKKDCLPESRNKDAEYVAEQLGTAGPKMKEIIKISANKFNLACATMNPQLVLEMEELQQEVHSKTCKIVTNTFEYQFNKKGDNWVALSGPNGTCQHTTLAVLSSEAGSSVLWSFTQTRVAVGSQDKSCDLLKLGLNKPAISSWKNTSSKEVEGCTYFDSSPL